MQLLLLSLLCGSITANVLLIREIIKVNAHCDSFKSETILYERQRGEKLEEILREEVRREILNRQTMQP